MPDLWIALRDVVWHWVEQGVKIFRVDNPHKPLPFWEWLIADIRERDRDVMFLSEAFTRPGMMARLGKVGFSQSYTYFTWRNTKAELSEYFSELNEPLRDCYRPNFFVNTPDINPFFLQDSGRAGFLIRAALATMGSGLWGMYSGFELCESAAIPGRRSTWIRRSIRSGHATIRHRATSWPRSPSSTASAGRTRRCRRTWVSSPTWRGTTTSSTSASARRTCPTSSWWPSASTPHNAQEAHFELPLWELGLPDDAHTQGEDLMNGHRWTWYGKTQWMRIEPWHLPFGIWRLTAQRPDPDLK